MESKPKYVLLCSDGLTNFVDNATIHSIILQGSSPEDTCTKLIDKANENGGGDNITAVLIELDGYSDDSEDAVKTEDEEV